jgi:hypothetical protein
MKVKDLIKFLSEQDQNLEVVIKHTDPSDWTYELPLRTQDVRVEEVYEVVEYCYSFRDNLLKHQGLQQV